MRVTTLRNWQTYKKPQKKSSPIFLSQMLDPNVLRGCVDRLREQPVFHQEHLLPAHGHPHREGQG